MRAAIVLALLLAACSHAPAGTGSNSAVTVPRPSDTSLDQPPTAPLVPGNRYVADRELCIDRELARLRLNEYGDPPGTTYTNGSPLRNEVTGAVMNRYDYVVARRRDIGATCARSPGEPDR